MMDLGRGRNLLYFIAAALVMLIALALMIAFFFDLSPRKPKDPTRGRCISMTARTGSG